MFTTAEALAAGWTTSALERAAASGRLVRLRRGVYVARHVDGDRHPAEAARRHRARQAVAAALVTDRATVTALSAATLRGWPVWAPREGACLTVGSTRTTSIRDVHLHRGGIAADARARVAGFWLTGPTRTVVDIAREFGTEAGLVVADAAVAAGLTSPERLQREVGRLIGRRGIGAARPLAELVDPLSESVLESRSRWQCVAYDLPAPRTQVTLRDRRGVFLGRADFYWDCGVVGEVDGAGKLEDPLARRAFLERQSGLLASGLRLVRWIEPDLRVFGPIASRLRVELAAARSDPRPPGWVAELPRLGVGSPVRDR